MTRGKLKSIFRVPDEYCSRCGVFARALFHYDPVKDRIKNTGLLCPNCLRNINDVTAQKMLQFISTWLKEDLA